MTRVLAAALMISGVAACTAIRRPSANATRTPVTSGEEQMEDRQVIAFHTMMSAVNAGDARRYAMLYAPDAVVTIHGGGVLNGRDAIEQYEVELLRQFPGTRFAFYDLWQKGGSAVVRYGVNSPALGGRSTGHEGLLYYRFHPSGLIAEEHRYLDSMTPMAQMGVLGASPARPLPTLPARMKAHTARNSLVEDENVAIVRASFDALDLKNESAFLAAVADDAVVDELVQPQPFVGKRNVRAWLALWAKAVPDAKSEITSILGAGEFVLAETVVRGTLSGQFGRVSASNKPFAVHRAVIVEVKDGKLTRVSAFMNGKELAEAVGQWPPSILK